MSSAWINRRTVGPSRRTPKARTSFQVLYRRRGRDSSIRSAGSFKTEREAKIRLALVAGWLAGGQDPQTELARLAAPQAHTRLGPALDAWLEEHERSVKPNSNRGSAIKWAKQLLGKRDPLTLMPADFNALVKSNAALSPRTVHTYHGVICQFLDDLGVEPNPGRHRSVKLPRIVQAEKHPPAHDHVLAIANALSRKALLPFVVLELTGMRVGELAKLQWGDVDVPGCRFRLRRETVKTRRPRWVELPMWVMIYIGCLLAPEDRDPLGRVFPAVSERLMRTWIAAACSTAEIPHFTPKDLRDRRASLWHHHGDDPVGDPLEHRPGWEWRAVADRLGQSKPSITMDVYSWILEDPREVQADEWAGVLA
ncbi:MAG: tyrosine-type recombinase/integrase [Solirubrobacterales bacterium]|nr:site-specific integrase [Solirubrobacterales bacterium]